MKTKVRKLELQSVPVSRIVAVVRDRQYIWEQNQDERDFLDKMKIDHEYEKIHGHTFQTKRLSDVCADYDTDSAFVFYVSDCFDPPLFLIFGSSFQDAYDTFITEFEGLIKIEENELADYGENYSVNDNGTPVDTESVNGFSVDKLIIETTPKRCD